MVDPSNTGAAAPAAAWHVDPTDPAQWRWWDGTQWTEHVAPLRPVEAQQAVQAEAVVAEAHAPVVDERWRVPPADSPLFPNDGYPKDVHPGFVAPRRSLHLRRAPMTGVTLAIGGTIAALGALADHQLDLGFGTAGVNIMNHALWGVHDDARDAPWAEVFRRRGLDPARGFHPRWMELTGIAEGLRDGSVNPRWSAGGAIGGMPATCGEYYCEVQKDGRDTRSYSMFAAFELPPLAGARHRKVVARRRGMAKLSLGTPSGTREVRFESIAVDRALRICVDEGTDDVAVRELFGPQLLSALAEHPVEWDQKRDLLLVRADVPKEPGRAFDAFVRSAAAVARAYWSDQE
jgi:hypothetical protein